VQEATPPEIQDGTLSIQIREVDSVRTVVLAGELDLANATSLALELEREPDGELVLDMSGLEFIDSTGIALLVRTHHRLNGDDIVRFRLVGSTSPAVKRVMSLTGLDAELPSGNGRQAPQA